MPDIRHIHAAYDPEGWVWWAESNDLLGLVSYQPALTLTPGIPKLLRM